MKLRDLLIKICDALSNFKIKARGNFGEFQVQHQLKKSSFIDAEHHLINNLVLLDKNNKTTEIDHIEIRHNGIFVIETKNYSGLIFGKEKEQYWTQVKYRYQRQFLNPLMQNNYHIHCLNKILKYRYKINSIVVFTQNNAPKSKIDNVLNLYQLRDYLDNFNDGTYYQLQEMDEILQTLLKAGGNLTKKDHLNNLKNRQH